MLTRRAYINLLYNNISITRDINNSLLGFTYEDYASGYSDNVSVALHNISKKWLNEWAPEQGANLEAYINTINWHHDNDTKQLTCGSFFIDQLDYAGRPLTCHIGALALELNTPFREQKRNKAWQKITIRELATAISNQNNLELVFDSKNNIKLYSVKQSDMSDLEFLTQTCKKYGYAIKLYNKKVVIYREEEYESKSNYKIIREEDVIDWSGSKSLSNTAYDGCSIDYTNQLSGKKLSYSFNPQQGSKILKISDVVNSLTEAEYMTKAALRTVNKSQTIININMIGDPTIVSTSLIQLEGFGILDGKYFIDLATHNLPDYKMTIEAHRVLEGY